MHLRKKINPGYSVELQSWPRSNELTAQMSPGVQIPSRSYLNSHNSFSCINSQYFKWSMRNLIKFDIQSAIDSHLGCNNSRFGDEGIREMSEGENGRR
jgi:hypothetical protein